MQHPVLFLNDQDRRLRILVLLFFLNSNNTRSYQWCKKFNNHDDQSVIIRSVCIFLCFLSSKENVLNMLPCFCPWEELAGGQKAERVIFSPFSFWLCLWHQSQQQHKATLGCCSNSGIRPSLTGSGFKSTHSTHMQMVRHVSFWILCAPGVCSAGVLWDQQQQLHRHIDLKCGFTSSSRGYSKTGGSGTGHWTRQDLGVILKRGQQQGWSERGCLI